MYYLDTNICNDFLHGKLEGGAAFLERSDPGLFRIPALVQAELLLGAAKSEHPQSTRRAVESFLLPFEIVPFDERCAYSYAQIRADLEKKGQIIGPNDLCIAAIVLANNGTLITNNSREFSRVRGLSVETWKEVDY